MLPIDAPRLLGALEEPEDFALDSSGKFIPAIFALADASKFVVRVLPLLGTLLFAVLAGLLAVVILSFDFTMGVPSLFTISVMLLSIAFPTITATSTYVILRERKAAMNRWAYWHSVLVTWALTVVAVYMGYWGMI